MPKNNISWDVTVVLKEWADTHNDYFRLYLLQENTNFMLALASGARRGEIWALTHKGNIVSKDPLTLSIPFDE